MNINRGKIIRNRPKIEVRICAPWQTSNENDKLSSMLMGKDITALIDTGSPYSCAASYIMDQIDGLELTRKIGINLGNDSGDYDAFRVRVCFGDDIFIDSDSFINHPRLGAEEDCILGRDILNKGKFIYDPKNNVVEFIVHE